uniref:Uncharacterized protein LOC113790354 n=1 Tax=Dermatophagoides pteronyssinus TaxID=6956 RepID=A0A6P6XSK4_DERPT|nr:uncharacterized protein LOC113790354 [Dermatophagoides pteronyssinus]
MDSNTNMEESTSLTTSKESRHHHYHCQQRSSPRSMLHYSNRERRIRLIRLGAIYYFTWILLIIFSLLIPPYIYLLFPEPECWYARKIQVNLSLILAITTSVISLLLFIVQCMTRIKITLFRRNFCRLTFFLFTMIAIINFIIAIYFFNMFSCYFDQHTPDEIIDDNNDWFTNITIRYDLKIIAIIHLLCSILAFFTGIGFAIIRHNFKYVLRVEIH